MKKILLLIPFILGFCLYTGAQSTTGTRVTSMVVPNDSLDDYATHDSYFGRGGYRTVKTIAERDAIKASRKIDGMLVYVVADGNTYKYLSGVWTKLTYGVKPTNNILQWDSVNNYYKPYVTKTSVGTKAYLYTGAGFPDGTDTLKLNGNFIASNILTDNKYNLSIGLNNLKNNSIGHHNQILGFNNLTNNTTGYYNCVAGFNSLTSNISGSSNVAIGANTLYSNLYGSDNVAIGSYAQKNGIATGSTAVGSGALFANNGGGENCAYGYRSMYSNTGGYGNVAIGAYSLSAISSGHHNVAIGYNAGVSYTGSNHLIIDNSITDRPLIFGSFADDSLYINGTLGVRTLTGTGNRFTMVGSDGVFKPSTFTPEPALGNPSVNGYVLSSTTAGVRSWVPASSGGVTPTNNILQWDATKSYYTPYAYDKTNGLFRLSKSDQYIQVATNPNDSMLVVNGGIATQTKNAPAGILHSNNAEGGTIYSDYGTGANIYSDKGKGANIYTVSGFSNLVVGNGYDTTCFRQDGSIAQYKAGVKKWEVQTDGSVNIPTGANYKINGVPIGSGATWGSITGTLSSQTDLNTALAAKEPTITAGTTAQYYRGDKTWQTLNSSAVGLGNVLNLAQEPALGNPASNGYILSSTTAGVRSWIPVSGGGTWGSITGTLSNQTDLNTALTGKESTLGNPAADGYVLSSTAAGVRSWVPNSANITNNSVFNDSVSLLIDPTNFSTLTGISLTAGTWLINYGGENSGSWNNNAQNSNIFFSLGSTAWDGTAGTINTRSSIRGYYANFNRSLVVTITGTQSVWLRIKRAVETGAENCCIRSIYMTALKLNN